MIYLVRHGESGHNSGASDDLDSPLSNRGIEQVEALAHYFGVLLHGSGRAKIYSSPLQRAIQTASPIAQILSSEIIVDSRIHESRFKYCGYAEEDCEEPEAVIDRLSSFVNDVRNTSEVTIVISHGTPVMTMRAIFCERAASWDEIDGVILPHVPFWDEPDTIANCGIVPIAYA